jgi:hypothetical protein
MRIYLLISTLLVTCIPCGVGAGEPNQQDSRTNLAEILQYVDKFAKTLDIDVPSPLTTNDVTQFLPAGIGGVAGVRISGRYHFVFDARYHFIHTFTDRKYSMLVQWRAEAIEPLIQQSKVSTNQAVEMARNYLTKLGYSEEKLPPLLPPEVHQWTWGPDGAPKVELLPFFTIVWKWKKNPDMQYCNIEIDGLRRKVTFFDITYTLHEADIPNP